MYNSDEFSEDEMISIEQENAEWNAMMRYDSARWLTVLLPAVQSYVLNCNDGLEPGDPDYLPYPTDLCEIYSDSTFVALVNSRLLRYTYSCYYDAGSRDEPPFYDENLDITEVV